MRVRPAALAIENVELEGQLDIRVSFRRAACSFECFFNLRRLPSATLLVNFMKLYIRDELLP